MQLNPYTFIKSFWPNWRYKSVTIVLLIIAIITIFVLISSSDQPIEENEQVNPVVTISTLSDLNNTATIEKTAVINSNASAPLIARTGGRVTNLSKFLGDEVYRGQIIAQIDGGIEANPTRAQAGGLSKSLSIFKEIESAALSATQNAVDIAKINLDAAKSTGILTTEQAVIVADLANNTQEGTRLALQDAQEGGSDTLIRTNDLANKAARLAQEQANIGKSLSAQSTANAIKLAQEGYDTALLTQNRTKAELASQQQNLSTSLAVANESIRLQQIIAPVSGQISQLSIKQGDFISPGQQIGEVVGGTDKTISVDVPTGTRNSLSIGQKIDIANATHTITGEIIRIANHPNTATGFWQVDINATDTDKVFRPGSSVNVVFSTGTSQSDTTFLPLDSITVRQDGIFIFTIDDQNIAKEEQISITAYDGDYIETNLNLSPNTKIVLTGNRTLRDGNKVEIK